MATDASTLYKLIILYMLDRVNSPMTNAQISQFILEKGYTTYFTLQEVISTLISDGFITEESYHSSTPLSFLMPSHASVKRLIPINLQDILHTFRRTPTPMRRCHI